MSKQWDSLIKNGFIVSSKEIKRLDIAIKQGKIVETGIDLSPSQSEKTIDAHGCYVLPGVIDPHCHPVYVDDMGDSSITAAYGGVTTIIHYAYVKPGMQVIPTLQQFRDDGESKSVLDFALHLGLFDVENQIKHLEKAFKMGITSLKVFMTYAKLGWMTDDYWLTAVLDVAAKNQALVMIHAENGLATDYLEDKYLSEGASALETFTAMRPDILEAEAVNRAMSMAHLMGSALYVVHNSAAACIEPLTRAKEKGWRVIGETCPQYLALTEETTRRFKAQAKIGPPLRTRDDNLALWKGLSDGILQIVGSDHAPKSKKVDDDFFDAPYGSPQIETMLPVMYHFGVNAGRITLPRLVEVMSENPARYFGLYPQKGILQAGSDADVVIFDAGKTQTLKAENQHSNVGYTLYEGSQIMGMPLLTMQRGNVIIEDGKLVAQAGCGKFIPTDTSHLYH